MSLTEKTLWRILQKSLERWIVVKWLRISKFVVMKAKVV
jgi:hypothetical protein